jgi:uncharacterized membrane protein
MAEYARTPVTKKDISPQPEKKEFDMDLLVGYILLAGVLLSILLILIGLIWNWVQTGQLGIEYGIQGMNLFGFVRREVIRLVTGNFRPRLLVNWGIAILLLTPYTRVLASMLYFFFVEHNWKYTIFTAFVFGVLTYSLFLR